MDKVHSPGSSLKSVCIGGYYALLSSEVPNAMVISAVFGSLKADAEWNK